MSELVTAPGLSQELRGEKKVFLQDVWRPGTVGCLMRNMDEFSVFAGFQVIEPQWSSSVQTCKRHAVCSLLLLLPDVQLFTWLSFSKHSRHELKFDIIRRRRKMHKSCCHIHLKHSVTHSCVIAYMTMLSPCDCEIVSFFWNTSQLVVFVTAEMWFSLIILNLWI